MEDREIIELFFLRSERAIEELDRKYGGLCRSVAWNILGSREDAEECVNDARLAAWNAIPPARPDPLRAYMVKTVRNISVKLCRRRGAAKRSPELTVAMEEMGECIPGGDTVEETLDARELAREIEGFLDTLSKKERIIFVRRYGYMDAYGDIARVLGISEKNVSARISLIRRKLREHLREGGVSV